MKSLLVLLTLLLAPVLAPAQSLFSSPDSDTKADASPPPQPATQPSGAASGVPLPGQSTGPELEKNPPLMPENIPAEPGGGRTKSHKAHPGSSPGVSTTFATEQELLVRIRIRKAETRALNDPAVQADWVAAHATRTDPDRRAALTTYYTHLYREVLKLEPKLATEINARRDGAIARMKYTRLYGTADAPVDPAATPIPVAPGQDFSDPLSTQ